MGQREPSIKKRFSASEENLKKLEKIIEPFTDQRKIIVQRSPEKWSVTSYLYL